MISCSGTENKDGEKQSDKESKTEEKTTHSSSSLPAVPTCVKNLPPKPPKRSCSLINMVCD